MSRAQYKRDVGILLENIEWLIGVSGTLPPDNGDIKENADRPAEMEKQDLTNTDNGRE